MSDAIVSTLIDMQRDHGIRFETEVQQSTKSFPLEGEGWGKKQLVKYACPGSFWIRFWTLYSPGYITVRHETSHVDRIIRAVLN